MLQVKAVLHLFKLKTLRVIQTGAARGLEVTARHPPFLFLSSFLNHLSYWSIKKIKIRNRPPCFMFCSA